MTVLTDAQRRTLHEGAQKAMGKEPADILLASLPPQGWGDLATKTDLALGLAEVRVEIANVRAELGGKIANSTRIHVGATIGALVSVAAICVAMIARI
jgi:hypothetical protein